ncbi:pimeloyl-ACP methyl ester esterase BioH [Frateuria aurantia]
MKLAIETRGRGPVAMVWIHGWAMHSGIFEPLVQLLEDQCTLYLVDLPGHGHSADSDVPLGPAACADAIARNVPPAWWLGWSLGGLIAMQAALRHREQVAGLFMLCATPRFTRADDWPHGSELAQLQALAQSLQHDYHGTIDRFLSLEAMGSADPKSELRTLRSETFSRGEPRLDALQQGLAILEQTDLRSRLPELRLPGAWIAGRRDRVVHPGQMRAAAAAAGMDYAEMDHAGHAPFIGHAPELAQILRQHLTSPAIGDTTHV